MVHGYHVILPCYGFWFPNDPRGSWSDFVASWEIVRFGKSTRLAHPRALELLTDEELARRETKQAALLYAPVVLTGLQALSVASGFAKQAKKCGYAIWACAILPEDTHLVIARHSYRIEQVANLLKGAATRQLVDDPRHPLVEFAKPGNRPPGMWARHQWKVYLDCEHAIENAIADVVENPIKEGKRRQNWNWVAPFAGLEPGWTTYQ